MGSRQKRQYADLSKPRVHWDLRVELPEDGLRLDQFLVKRIRWRSRNQIQTLIDEGRVRVDDLLRKASTRMRDGTRVVIDIPAPLDPPDPSLIPIETLYDDGRLVLVNKQPGIVVHPVGKHQLDNLLSALHSRYRRPDRPDLDRVPHICHRIDTDTSGAYLVALDEKTKGAVGRQFEDRVVRKEYLALVRGVPEPREGVIDEPILYREAASPRLGVHEDGLPSRTDYRVEADLGNCALVRFFPKTGRTHQIRVHAAYIGHSLLCDWEYAGTGPVYAGETPPEAAEEREPLLSRCGLHSARLTLHHPGIDAEIDFHAPLPADMRATVRAARAGPICWGPIVRRRPPKVTNSWGS